MKNIKNNRYYLIIVILEVCKINYSYDIFLIIINELFL